MKHWLQQFKLYRKYMGGNWVKVINHLPMPSFWCLEEEILKCCGARVIDREVY